MKRGLFILALLLLFFTFSSIAQEQQSEPETKTTIILLRHAEKAPGGGNNPMLSAEGRMRAERLYSTFRGIRPDAFYSTDFIRTRATISPWAARLKKEVQIYDPENLPQFAEMLTNQVGKTIVVVGHANTMPSLVNLLIKKEKYQQLPDNDYSKIFVVTIQNG